MTLSMIRLFLSNSQSFLVLSINPLFFTDTLLFGESRLLLLVGNFPLFSLNALLFGNFLLPLFFLFL